MSGIFASIMNTLSAALSGTAMDPPTPPYVPSIDDVFAVKDAIFARSGLPLEIIDVIIDFADYWACTSTCRTGGEISVRAGRPATENQLILRSYPLGYVPTTNDPTTCPMSNTSTSYPSISPQPWLPPDNFPTDATPSVLSQILKTSQIRGERPCRKIVFTLKSHDQGWGGTREQKNTYTGSYTWFEAGKERLTAFKDYPYIKMATLSTADLVEGDVNQHEEVEGEDMIPFDQSGVQSLPHFAFTSRTLDGDEEKEKEKGTEVQNTICTVHTILPTIGSRYTAHEPPRTDSWFNHSLMPSPAHIQRNLTANRETQTHTIAWRHDDHYSPAPESEEAHELDKQGRGVESLNGEYVRGLKIGDVVTVWAKARFPMWVNTVSEVKIDVYWAV